MKKALIIGLMAIVFASGIGCTNMSRTQQGVASGAALGALGGAGVAAIAGGAAGWGALAGAGVGALAGGIVGHQQDKNYRW
ncbi:cell envelope biogenesis protein OmpA [Desulfovibrio sp. SGI.169]|uniref:cell envelope biogenesis protein OmpA n=1 Tax=Desulfovibrio sp. SGI.169 TaxID=3420561 RepID=UPI003D0220C1